MRLGIIALALAAACTPSPNAPPWPDASDAATVVVIATAESTQACANLARLGCKADEAPTCPGVLSNALREHHVTAECVAWAAKTTDLASAGKCAAYFACTP